MKAETVKAMLPVITAFAEGRIIQFRDLRPSALRYGGNIWSDVNPNTTEFRLSDDTNPDEWRVKPE